MKNIIIIGICIFFYALSSSCTKVTNFLDKPPGIDVTEDTIFTTQINAETFLMNCYSRATYCDLPNWDENDGKKDVALAASTDESISTCGWYWDATCWNIGDITPNNTDLTDTRWLARWNGIRSCNIFLERISSVPKTDPGYINPAKGQAMWLRALSYFELLKRYGGVPIVKKRFLTTDNFKIPRSTFKETVDFIVTQCDSAASLLPDIWPSVYRGKATKGAALMLKARTLLYAASPEFNTSTPYLDLGNNNNLICYGDYDVNRWQQAADAAKAVIDWAPAGSISLVTTATSPKPYQYIWETHDNSEIILSNKYGGSQYETAQCIYWMTPPSIYYGEGGCTVTFNWQKLYENKTTGQPQNWNPNGGNNLSAMYDQLDPRFGQTIAYNGSYWNTDYTNIETYQGGQEEERCLGGAWVHKFFPSALTWTNVYFVPNWWWYRLAEAYLNYAEALNEAQGPVAEAYAAVNIIRQRAGMPDFPAGLTKEQFRNKLRNERSVELAFEEHRFCDVRRWLIADNEGIMNGKMYGLKITENPPPSTEFSYVPYVIESHVFTKKMYLHPFPKNEVNKGYLVQNPGY